MITYALTGGIGAGKSVVGDLLVRWGFPLLDTDIVARQVVEPGRPALDDIRRVFGSEMVRADGCLDRTALAGLVFQNPVARRQLEEIVHPRIRETWTLQLQRWREAQRPTAVIVVPLLFEIGAETAFDCTVCVACPVETQWRRLRGRGWDDDQIRLRLAAQLPLPEKMRRADRVVWNDAGLDLVEAQVRRVFGVTLGFGRAFDGRGCESLPA